MSKFLYLPPLDQSCVGFKDRVDLLSGWNLFCVEHAPTNIVGEHTATSANASSSSIRAHNYDTFARGALRAAQWLAKRKPGLYGMQDLLGYDADDATRISNRC